MAGVTAEGVDARDALGIDDAADDGDDTTGVTVSGVNTAGDEVSEDDDGTNAVVVAADGDEKTGAGAGAGQGPGLTAETTPSLPEQQYVGLRARQSTG